VLGWAAAEAATLLGGSTASVNSALQRARETLGERNPGGQPLKASPMDSTQQALPGRYLQAWERLNVADFAALLKEEATYVMPPTPNGMRGARRSTRSSIGRSSAMRASG
jgi:RNA polymerase sigma-70 factor (ECF subfamily)